MNWRAPAHRTRLVRVDVGEESRGRANHHHDQRQRASAARPKRSVGRDGRRDRIGEGSVTHLTLTATAGPSSSRLGGRVRSVWRHQRRRIEIGIYLTGDNAMPRRGIGEGAGVWAHFLPTWEQRDAQSLVPLLPAFPFQVPPTWQHNRRSAEPEHQRRLCFARYPWRQNQILNEKLLVWACLDSEFNINFYINLFNSSRYKFLALQMHHVVAIS